MMLARAEHRVVVTDNLRDFRPLHHEVITLGGPGHHGMVFLSRPVAASAAAEDDQAFVDSVSEWPGE